jgi:hypothetical protein
VPKVAEITLYRYRELEGLTGRTIGRNVPQETAKHNVGDHWYEQSHEDERHVAEGFLTEKGLPMSLMEMAVDTSCTQGSGMSITGNFSLSDADECEALVDIATDYPQFRPDHLTVVVTRSNGHYVHSNMMRVEVEWEGDAIVHDLTETTIDELHELGLHEAWAEQPLSDMAERIRAVLIDLCDDAHRKAEDCALSDSDGYINEWMDDMGYWFDEDGQIIKRSED